ncbi:MAG: aspartate carbamoyltransferase [Spirochaetales bacterium]|nr:aspartate carbamoyltransferase [Spirochaetales bacterium]
MTTRNGPFKGRSISVVNDLSIDEQRYLYRKARLLKEDLAAGGRADGFRIADPDYSAYLVFLENSTRTRESFRNAAEFHNVRVNVFDAATSSFAKNESVTDTFKMLIGYAAESCFVVRSKLEGTCTWLASRLGPWAAERGMSVPSFINAGDGKHEHPTQEFLDEFSFLEQRGWKEDSIHLALVGDLYHGRTVHSKADGLRVFKEVRVDLVAPPELTMPPFYVDAMKRNGFEVRVFESVDEYLAAGNAAPLWYFTRLQLERMGDSVLEKAPRLRKAVTFRRELVGKLPDGARFYHPLPRDRLAPTIPTWLDDTALNGWDAQSANGYYTRVVEMAMLAGRIGQDFDGTAKESSLPDEDFVVEAPVAPSRKPEYKVGIKPVERGIVIDHIASGEPVTAIWDRVDMIRRVLNLNLRSSHGVYHSNRGPELYKGIISIPDRLSFGERELKKLGAVSPGCTINLIEDQEVKKKYRLGMPPRIYDFDDISCANENCISHPKHEEHIAAHFLRKVGTEGGSTYVCRWCEREHDFSEIWSLKGRG